MPMDDPLLEQRIVSIIAEILEVDADALTNRKRDGIDS